MQPGVFGRPFVKNELSEPVLCMLRGLSHVAGAQPDVHQLGAAHRDGHRHGFSQVQLFVTLWTVACQAPLPMGFFRQEYWSG